MSNNMTSKSCVIVAYKFILAIVITVGAVILPSITFADIWSSPAPTAKNVLCVYNSNEQISADICAYYLKNRSGANKLALNIPTDDYITGEGTTDENMSYSNFMKDVYQPIIDYVDSHKELNITHIAAAKGIPIRVTLLDRVYPDTGVVMSGNNFLLYDIKDSGTLKDLIDLNVNNSKNQTLCIDLDKHFNTQDCSGKYRFVVSYLTGYTLEDVKKLIDKAQAKEPDLSNDKWFLDETKKGLGIGGQNLSFVTMDAKNGLINSGIKSTNIKINKNDATATTTTIIDDYIVAYNGWGVWKGYNTNWLSSGKTVEAFVANRAIIDVYESYFGISNTKGAISTGQSRIAEALMSGAFGGENYSRSFSGGVGTVTEPNVQGLVRFNRFASAYARGLTFAESFLYAVQNEISPMGIAIGDPLMRLQDSKTITPTITQDLPSFETKGNFTSHYDYSLEIISKSTNPSMSALIDWGDGNSSDIPLEILADNSHGVTVNHTYSKFGLYFVSVVVNDSDSRESIKTNFTVKINPLIEVKSPTDDNTVLSAGQSVTVEWSSPDLSQNDLMVIGFYNVDNSAVGYTVDENGVPNNGSYSWIIPKNIEPGRYAIQVGCKTCQGVNTSAYGWSKTFNIKSSSIIGRLAQIGTSFKLWFVTPNVVQNSPTNVSEQIVTEPSLAVRITPIQAKSPAIAAESSTLESSPLPLTTQSSTKSSTSSNYSESPLPTISPSSIVSSSPGQSLITINKPNGGENFTAGQKFDSIVWSSANLPASTNIDNLQFSLVSSKNFNYVLTVTKSSAFSAGFDGNYSNNGRSFINGMNIPLSIQTGNYKLKIFCNSCGNISDISDDYFSILASNKVPSISIVAPTANQIVNPGGKLNLQWRTQNIDASEPITVFAFNQNNTTIGYDLAGDAGIPNSGNYYLTLPANMALGQYALQIQCKNCLAKFGTLTYAWSQAFKVASLSTSASTSSSSSASNTTPTPSVSSSPSISPSSTPSPSSSPETSPSPSSTPSPSSSPGTSPSPSSTPSSFIFLNSQTGTIWDAIVEFFNFYSEVK
jgi:hypothetical protein